MFKRKNLIIAGIVLGALLVGAGLHLKSTTKEKTDFTASAVDSSLGRGETRPTLPPSSFSKDAVVAQAYQIAKDIPQVLDSLECYCYCDRPPFNHKSLLSCYVDEHASV